MKHFSITLLSIIILLLYACSDNNQKGSTDTYSPPTIYVANIGNLDREKLAEKITTLQKFNPKVIGIDAVFKERKEEEKDQKLKDALNIRNNIVLGSFLKYTEDWEAYGIITTNQYFGDLPFGFCELIIDEESEAESIEKQVTINGKTIYPLSTEVIRVFDPDAFEYYKSNTRRTYNFKYSENDNDENIKIEEIDFEEITDTSSCLNKITNGIVLLGYLRNDQNAIEIMDSIDNFTYSDHTGKYIVKGVKIHAYIIGKILNEYNKSKN